MADHCNHEGTKLQKSEDGGWRMAKGPISPSSIRHLPSSLSLPPPSCLRAFVVNIPAMAQSKHEIQSLLAGAGTEPRHRFGQNFMIDQNLVRLVADAGGIAPGDLVVEVGPGTGTLTDELLARGAELVAVEIDRDLAGLLRERLDGNERFTLIEGDALASKHRLNADLLERINAARAAGRGVKLVANLPYNIASPLVIELLIAGIDLL